MKRTTARNGCHGGKDRTTCGWAGADNTFQSTAQPHLASQPTFHYLPVTTPLSRIASIYIKIVIAGQLLDPRNDGSILGLLAADEKLVVMGFMIVRFTTHQNLKVTQFSISATSQDKDRLTKTFQQMYGRDLYWRENATASNISMGVHELLDMVERSGGRHVSFSESMRDVGYSSAQTHIFRMD